MKIIPLICTVALLTLSACTEKPAEQKKPQADATAIILTTIEKAGGEHFEQSTIHFGFRDIHYTAKRNGGLFEISRTFTDGANNVIHDCLDNLGFQRTINGVAAEMPDSLIRAFSNSVNSVHYFAQLPYGLDSPAAHHKLLDTVEVAGKPYFKIEVTFDEEGGGEDHEDVFLYWIHKDDFTVDYLAYSFHTDGGGMRFREAINPRVIGGIRWVDYRNFKPVDTGTDFYQLDSLFASGALKLLSLIELKNIEVQHEVEL